MRTKSLLNILLISLLPIFLLMIIIWYLSNQGYGISYQSTNSMPKGWYFTYPAKKILHRNDIVLFKPKSYVEKYMVAQGWIRPNMLLMKKVFAVPNDYVCVKNDKLYINKTAFNIIKLPNETSFPKYNICGHLPKNEYLLMSSNINRSFDSRYFGPINRTQIVSQGYKI